MKLSTQSSAAVLSAKTVVEFLQSTGIEIIEVDFSAEPTQAPASASAGGSGAAASSKKEKKDDAKLEDAKLIGITVDKEKDFLHGIPKLSLKVKCLIIMMFLVVTFLDQIHTLFGKPFKIGSMPELRNWVYKTLISQCLFLREFWKRKRPY